MDIDTDKAALMESIHSAFSQLMHNVSVHQTFDDYEESDELEQFFHVSGMLPGKINSVILRTNVIRAE
jgi:hypothetical protein